MGLDEQRLAELRRQAEQLDRMDVQQALARAAAQQQQQQQMHQGQRSYADIGLQAGMMVVVGSVVAGAIGFARGNRAFYNRMFSFRMITVATTLGFYGAAGGWIPAPTIMNTLMGREPRQMHTQPLWPQQRTAAPQQQQHSSSSEQ